MSLVLALIDALKTANQTVPDAEQLADAIWLAYYLTPAEPKETPLLADLATPPEAESTPTPHDSPSKQDEQSKPELNEERVGAKDATDTFETEDTQPATEVDLHAPDYRKNQSDTPSLPATTFPTPGAAALPHKLAISRSLRPLVRYVPSQSRTVLDEQESAELMAETGLPLLILRPEKERWLNGIILVDTWPSMAVWMQTAQEFTHLLTQLGAFRRLQSYTVTTTIEVESKIPTPHLKAWQTSAKRVVTAKELIDPTGRTLIYLLTDFASPAWATGAMGKLLNPLAQQNHLSVVSLIPDSHWSRTILSDGTAVRLQAPHANAPNHKLTPHFPLWYDEQEKTEIKAEAICAPLPLTILDPRALTHWAQFFTGKPAVTVPGYYLPQESKPPKPKQERKLTDKLWAHFVATTPREVRRLAAYLTTVPLTLPVIRLVQKAMLPDLTQADLARLLDSYLIYPVNQTVALGKANALQWKFIRGARKRLRTTLPTYRFEEVFREVSREIEKSSHGRYNFYSYIFLPDGNDTTLTGVDDVFGEAFARLSLTNLNYLGGKFKEIAAELATEIKNDGATNKKVQKERTPKHLLEAYDDALTLLGQGQLQAAREKLSDLLSKLPNEEPFQATVKTTYYEACQKIDIQNIIHQMSKAIDSADISSANEQVKAIKQLAHNNQTPILQAELDDLVNTLTQQQTLLRNSVAFHDTSISNTEAPPSAVSESSVSPHIAVSTLSITDIILIHLSEAMPYYLSETELREVYFRLHIDWSDLSLGGKKEKTLALLEHVARRQALIPLLIIHLYKVNSSFEWLQFPDKILPEQASELREIKRLVVIGDSSLGLKMLNPAIAERLSAQIDGLLNELDNSSVTQLEKRDLQDWSRDIDARMIERDNANLVFENHFPQNLNEALYKAGNPFPCLSAQDEISSLVKKRLFWDKHPIFHSLLTSQDTITVVHGESGAGRTAFCWGLYTYEAYHAANDFLIYVPYDVSRPPQLREYVAQNIWSYIAHKPTLLNKLDQTQLRILANRLMQVLGRERMKDDLMQWTVEYPWVKRGNLKDATLVKQEGLRCLSMFREALGQLNEPTTFMPNEENWLRNIRNILYKMAFRFEKFRILLDYQGTTRLPQTLRTQILEWTDWEVNVVVFMTTTEYKRHFPRPWSIPTYELTWSPEQLRELIYYRIGRQLRNHDRRRAVGNSDNMVNMLFASPEARDAWLSSGKTPRELFAVWQKMLALYSSDEELITESLVNKAKVLATKTENTITKEPDEAKTRVFTSGKLVGRQEAIVQAEQWRYSEKRLLTITGIPGIGKTWLLNHLVQLWDAEPNHIILHLDLQPYINAQQINEPKKPFGGSEQFFQAAHQFIEQCNVGVVFEPHYELAVTIEQVAKRLCEKHAQGYPIYLFLDGADALSHEEWGTLERQIIEPLCRCAELRFVISLQGQQIQSFPLRSQEYRLELAPLTKEEGRKQLKLLGINDKQVAGLIAQGYQLEHPGINTFLATKILDPQSHSRIDVNFLRELLLALGFIPSHQPDDVEYAIKLLLELADLPNQWSFAQYCQHRQLSASQGWTEIDFLQQCYLISGAPNNTQLYRIAPGLLPFLRIAQENMTRK